jgi:thioesterase domain-containing protein
LFDTTLRAPADSLLNAAARVPLQLHRLIASRSRLAFLRQRMRSVGKRFRNAAWRRIVSWNRRGGWLPRAMQSVSQANRAARRDYVPRRYGGRVALFRVNRRSELRAIDPLLGWGQVVSRGPDVHDVPGTHLTMVFEPHVRTLAAKLANCLEDAWTTSTEASRTVVTDDHKAA